MSTVGCPNHTERFWCMVTAIWGQSSPVTPRIEIITIPEFGLTLAVGTSQPRVHLRFQLQYRGLERHQRGNS